jgi:iron complex transport system ATP-binding protein
MTLHLQNVRYRYPGAARAALAGVSLTVEAGQFHAVLGPNGSGKTTLVRIALGALKPREGTAEIDGRPAAEWPRRELARLVGVVPQREDNLFPQRVRETVLLGRYPFLLGPRTAGRSCGRGPRARACDALELADRWLWTLSGGEYQRVRVARALAQSRGSSCPTSPVSHRFAARDGAVRLVRGLVETQRLGVLMITHDLNLAARFADSLLLLSEGGAVASGALADVLTQENAELSAGRDANDR